MSGRRLPEFADAISATLLLHDAETDEVIDANAAAEELYGHSVEELRGIDIARLSSENPQFSGEEATENIRAAARGDDQQFEWQIRRSNGELRWVRVDLESIELDGDPFVLAEIEDITEFKTRTRRLRLLHRIIRHNLRNDMTVVMGHAESLVEALDADDRQRQAELIHDVAEGVGSLTESIAGIEEIATNDHSDFRPVQVDDLIEEIAAEFREEYPEAAITVDIESPVHVSADRGLRLAFEQAVENAVVHADTDPEVTLRVAREDAGSRAIIEIVDRGPPISEMEVEAVDTTSPNSQTSHGQGTGLFVMNWCAESLGGKLEVLERDGRGNVVQFTLPAIEDREGEREDER
jgi:PAS domain S-box-containing protein